MSSPAAGRGWSRPPRADCLRRILRDTTHTHTHTAHASTSPPTAAALMTQHIRLVPERVRDASYVLSELYLPFSPHRHSARSSRPDTSANRRVTRCPAGACPSCDPVRRPRSSTLRWVHETATPCLLAGPHTHKQMSTSVMTVHRTQTRVSEVIATH